MFVLVLSGCRFDSYHRRVAGDNARVLPRQAGSTPAWAGARGNARPTGRRKTPHFTKENQLLCFTVSAGCYTLHHEEAAMPSKKKKEKTANENIKGGAEAYTPTRIEWLCVELNSLSFFDWRTEDVGLHAMFVPKTGDPDTVLVKFTFTDNVDADSKNALIRMAKDVIKHYACTRGWDTWLKMEVKIEMHEE